MKKLVVISGAGISAESGLKTFRDHDGLWNGHDVYAVASPAGWKANPQLVLDFYNARRKNVLESEPNYAHVGLAELEKHFDVTIITQNVDDLHERAGSTHVVHLHGEILRMRGEDDITETSYDIREDINLGDKAEDGSQLRPDIVWFHEPVPLMSKAIDIVESCDICVVIGTSLQVYPAASLLDYVPIHTPKYLIDKKIPEIDKGMKSLHIIEKPATEGVAELVKILTEQ